MQLTVYSKWIELLFLRTHIEDMIDHKFRHVNLDEFYTIHTYDLSEDLGEHVMKNTI